MKFYYWKSKRAVKKGDKVVIRRPFLPPLSGCVVFVHDAGKASPPKGDNPVGYAVMTQDGREFWFTRSEKSVTYVGTGETKA